jgi:outer membrane protein assembly factor BamB
MNGHGGSSPIIANNILYYAGNGAGRNGDNTLYALDPVTGTTIWSTTIQIKSGTGSVGGIHWESPIVAHGYVTSENGNTSGNVADGTGYLSAWSTP